MHSGYAGCPCRSCQIRLASARERKEEDPIVRAVTNRFHARSAEGIVSYGCTMADNPAPTLEWINHAQEELMDAILYLERLKVDFE